MNSSKTLLSKKRFLVTGGAGFIGSHLVDKLLDQKSAVAVLDNLNDYYAPAIKRANQQKHLASANFRFIEGDIRNKEDLERVLSCGPFDYVVHLAAMAGVRPSLSNPDLYMDVNVTGTQKLITALTGSGFSGRFIFGSSSSVYGARSGEQFLETDRVDQPLSPYAASKAAGELACYSAHHTSGLTVACLRFFTVYGPRQRPDLAIHKFAKLIENGQPIEVYGDGTSKRDYTFVSDIVSGIEQSLIYALPGFDIINLGSCAPVDLSTLISCLEECLGKKADILYSPAQLGDVPYTYASIAKARQVLGYQPSTKFRQGVAQFVEWYRSRRGSI